jgi:hypothetical protein
MSELLVALPLARALVIVDHEPRREQTIGARVRFLTRPFTTDQLVTAVSGQTGGTPSSLASGGDVGSIEADRNDVE